MEMTPGSCPTPTRPPTSKTHAYNTPHPTQSPTLPLCPAPLQHVHGDVNLSWPTGQIAVMGAKGAVEVIFRSVCVHSLQLLCLLRLAPGACRGPPGR